MIKLHQYILILFCILSLNLFSQNLSDLEKRIASDSIHSLLNKYKESHNFSADGLKISHSRVSTFESCFLSDGVETQNDLLTQEYMISVLRYTSDKAERNMVLSVGEYIEDLQHHYPSGVKVSLTEIKIIESGINAPKRTGDGYLVYVSLQKNLLGLLDNSKINRWSGELYFRVAFDKDAYGLKNFRIEKIMDFATYGKLVQNEQWKGNYVGFSYGMNWSYLNYGGFFDKPDIVANQDPLDIGIDIKRGNQFGLNYKKQFSSKFGISTGIQFQQVCFEQTISSFNRRTDTVETDGDGDNYLGQIYIEDYVSKDTIKMITIPLDVYYTISKGKNHLLSFTTGLRYMHVREENALVYGTVNYTGYYDKYPVVLDDLPDYGFTNNTYDSISFNDIHRESKSILNATVGLDLIISIKENFMFSLTPVTSMPILSYNHSPAGIIIEEDVLKELHNDDAIAPEFVHDIFNNTKGRLLMFSITAKILYKF